MLFGGLGAAGVALLLGLLGVVAVGVFSLATYWNAAGHLPANPAQASIASPSDEPTLLLDRQARRILYRVPNPAEQPPEWRTLDELPDYVWQAVVAIEDGDYFNRPGFSLPALMAGLQRAFFYGEVAVDDPLLLYLARQVVLPTYQMPLDHPDRAMTDVILVMEMRRRFSRQELLAWYLNTALYGNGVYGIETAARYYLGKSATELSLAEAALLAGVPAEPFRNPFDQPEAAFEQQKRVLGAMVAYAMITPDEAEEASQWLAITRPLAPSDIVAPHYALAAKRQAEMILNDIGYDGARLVADGGLRITTALDLDLQYQAECLLRTHVIRLGGVDPGFVYATAIGEPCVAAAYLPEFQPRDIGVPHDVTNGAAVVVEAGTGQVLAYVGSIDYWNEQIGGPLDSAAHPYLSGGMLRPYVYLTALSQGYTAATMTLDVEQTFSGPMGVSYTVTSPTSEYRGPMSLRRALVLDAAPPAAQMLNLVSVPDVLRTAHSMGLTTLLGEPFEYDVRLATEGGEVKLADLAYSFGVLANGGRMIGLRIPASFEKPGLRVLDPVMVLRIEDANGEVLWSYEAQVRDTLDPALAYLMNHIMGDRELRVIEYGAENVFDIGRPAAVHGSATVDASALWTVGYTPQISAGVWLGNTDGSPTRFLNAQNGPAPVWNALMRYVVERDALPVQDWQAPATIVEQPVCEVSGLLPTEHCPVTVEVFAAGTQPVHTDTYYQMVEVNRQNGKRATASTPRDLVEQRVYFNYPPEARAWAEAQGISGPPVEYDAVGPPPVFGPVAILEPDALAYVRGTVDIRGNATLPGFEYYQLAFGAGLNPTDWTQIGDRIYTPARGALLGRWNTAGLDGLYSLRLSVVTDAQEVQQSVIQVTVDNTPPQITVTTPEDGLEVLVSGLNPVLDVAAAVSDNVGVTEVVYYLDGDPVTAAIESPFTASIVIESTGQHSLWAEAFDAAGNSALSERISFTVRRSP
ncbi:MAG: PBP1A family penicillin-binding protein [Anaerolineae bacterium]